MAIEQLEGQTGNLRAVVCIYSRKKATVTELLEWTGVNKTPLYRALKILQSLGIIEKTKIRGFPTKILYTIAPEARGIARYISRIEEGLKKLQR